MRSRWVASVALALGAGAALGCPGGSGGGGGGGSAPAPRQAPALLLAPAFGGIAFTRPLKLVQHPSDDDRWYVVGQGGTVWTFRASDPFGTRSTAFDLATLVNLGNTTGEQGLLSLAFAPDFATSGKAFIAYTDETADASVLASVVSGDGGVTFALPPTTLLSVPHPRSNHNGGDLAFGPDGFLYYSLGDGGGVGDPDENGQDPTTLLGAILRLDVVTPPPGRPYGIPPGNRFASNPRCDAGSGALPCPEIFATGFRNPWRMNFDPDTGRLYAGDVGQDAREEIDLVVSGGNYGWDCLEGDLDFEFAPPCDTETFVAPEVVHGRADARAITGGAVYRGAQVPGLDGFYVYGDAVTGKLFAFDTEAMGSAPQALVLPPVGAVAFGQGRDGEVYVVALGGASIQRFVPDVPGINGSAGDDEFLDHLYALAVFGGIPHDAFQTHYFFSSFRGDDANPGTRAAPFRSLAKLFAICTSRVRCTLLDDGSVWSPNVLLTDAPGFGSRFLGGDAVTWGPGPGCPAAQQGEVIGVDAPLGIVAVRRADPAQPAPAPGDVLCDAAGGPAVNVAGVRDTAGFTPPVAFDLGCGNPDAPCILVEGENPSRPALIDFDWRDQGGAIFVATDDPAHSGGFLLLQNLACRYALDDCFGTTAGPTGGKLIGVGLECTVANAPGDENNNCLTTHGAGWITCVGCDALSLGWSSDGTGSPVAPTGAGGTTWIGPGRIRVVHRRSEATVPPLTATGNHLTLIGPSVEGASFGSSAFSGVSLISFHGDGVPGNGTNDTTIQIARAVVRASAGQSRSALAYAESFLVQDVHTTLSLWETTLSGDRCLTVGGLDQASMHLQARGVALDECASATFFDFGDDPEFSFDLEGLYDPDDPGALCVFGGSQADDRASCDALAAARSSSFFSNASIDSRSGSREDGCAWCTADYPVVPNATLAFVDANPDRITCAACDFVAAGFTAGSAARVSGPNVSPGNQRVFDVAGVSPQQLTLAAGDGVVPDPSAPGSEVRQEAPGAPAIHPDSNGFGVAIAPYEIVLPSADGYLPAFLTAAGQEIRSFQLEGGVGGR